MFKGRDENWNQCTIIEHILHTRYCTDMSFQERRSPERRCTVLSIAFLVLLFPPRVSKCMLLSKQKQNSIWETHSNPSKLGTYLREKYVHAQTHVHFSLLWNRHDSLQSPFPLLQNPDLPKFKVEKSARKTNSWVEVSRLMQQQQQQQPSRLLPLRRNLLPKLPAPSLSALCTALP